MPCIIAYRRKDVNLSCTTWVMYVASYWASTLLMHRWIGIVSTDGMLQSRTVAYVSILHTASTKNIRFSSSFSNCMIRTETSDTSLFNAIAFISLSLLWSSKGNKCIILAYNRLKRASHMLRDRPHGLQHIHIIAFTGPVKPWIIIMTKVPRWGDEGSNSMGVDMLL
jgi:hypothetical protein